MKGKEGKRATWQRDRERGSERARERELTRRKNVGAKIRTFSQTTNGNVI